MLSRISPAISSSLISPPRVGRRLGEAVRRLEMQRPGHCRIFCSLWIFWLGAAGCSGQDVRCRASRAGGCGFLGLEISPLVQKGSIFPVWLDSNFALVNYSLARFRNRPVLETAQGGVKCIFSIFALTFAVGKMTVFTFKVFNIFSIFFFFITYFLSVTS